MFFLVFYVGIYVLFNVDCMWFFFFEIFELIILLIVYDYLLYNFKLL